MTLPDKLILRVRAAPCIRRGTDWATDCTTDHRKHPECAVAAVLRALPESETVIAAARQAAVAKHGTLIGSLPEVLADAVLAAIAKLADDA